MKILITGGAGYKGSILAKELLDRNHQVTILDNFMYGYDSILHIINNSNLKIKKIDIRNVKETDLKEYDVIYHLAGISGMPACAANPHSAEAINVESVDKMIKILSKDQILINASTTSMYGYSEIICDEKSQINPVSIYGKTKYEAEKIIQNRENSISLRFATVFGVSTKMRNDLMVNDFVYRSIHERNIILFAAHTKRTFIHINDAINAYIFTLDNFEAMKDDVYNVGDEKMNLSKLDICENIKDFVKFETINSTLPDLDNRNFEISFQKIKKLGYNVNYSLRDGVEDLVKLYTVYVYNLPYNII
jgi:nucleoside-diphosphate-sugar epimerase